MIEVADARCRFGQLHVRQLRASGKLGHLPLLGLHPSPHSGEFFATVMSSLNAGRDVLAPDYPGYGESDPPPSPPSIGDYAAAILDGMDEMNVAMADAFGFHTGCLVGIEIALRDATRIRRLVLVDIPYYERAEREEMYARAVKPTGPDDRSHWGFHAAFTYPSDERFPLLTTPSTVVATDSPLLDATRAAATVLPNAKLVECLDITRPVFENRPERIAGAILDRIGMRTT